VSGDLIQQLLDDLAAERALADRLADALRATKSSNRSWSDRLADVALAAYKNARRASMTGAERYFAARLANPEYRQAYEEARRE
jgi:hypothetical protein